MYVVMSLTTPTPLPRSPPPLQNLPYCFVSACAETGSTTPNLLMLVVLRTFARFAVVWVAEVWEELSAFLRSSIF